MAMMRSSLFWRLKYGHEALLAGEALVYQQVLFIVAQVVAEIYVNHLPTMTLELMAGHPMKVLVIYGIVGGEDGGIDLCFDLESTESIAEIPDSKTGNVLKIKANLNPYKKESYFSTLKELLE